MSLFSTSHVAISVGRKNSFYFLFMQRKNMERRHPLDGEKEGEEEKEEPDSLLSLRGCHSGSVWGTKMRRQRSLKS